jgi:hypothetical protein
MKSSVPTRSNGLFATPRKLPIINERPVVKQIVSRRPQLVHYPAPSDPPGIAGHLADPLAALRGRHSAAHRAIRHAPHPQPQALEVRCDISGVVQTGSVTEAAARLDVAPSAVSRHIAHLEAQLDTLLFDAARAAWCPMRPASCWPATRRAWLEIERVADEIQACRACKAASCGWPAPKALPRACCRA